MNNYYNHPYPMYSYPMTPVYMQPYGMHPASPVTFPNPWEQRDEMYLSKLRISDHGKEPYVININQEAKKNTNFRTALWTGKHLQVTLMSINTGDDIGLEVHHNVDQFLRIEDGIGLVTLGKTKDQISEQTRVNRHDAIMVPAGTWHNITNIGHTPLKLYSIYAPPEHPAGTIHQTKKEALAAESDHHHHHKK